MVVKWAMIAVGAGGCLVVAKFKVWTLVTGEDDIHVAPANDPIAIVMGAAPEFLSSTELQIFQQLSVAAESAARHLEMAEKEDGSRTDEKFGVRGG